LYCNGGNLYLYAVASGTAGASATLPTAIIQMTQTSAQVNGPLTATSLTTTGLLSGGTLSIAGASTFTSFVHILSYSGIITYQDASKTTIASYLGHMPSSSYESVGVVNMKSGKTVEIGTNGAGIMFNTDGSAPFDYAGLCVGTYTNCAARVTATKQVGILAGGPITTTGGITGATLSISGSSTFSSVSMLSNARITAYSDAGTTVRGYVGTLPNTADWSFVNLVSGNWMRIGTNGAPVMFYLDNGASTTGLPGFCIGTSSYCGGGSVDTSKLVGISGGGPITTTGGISGATLSTSGSITSSSDLVVSIGSNNLRLTVDSSAAYIQSSTGTGDSAPWRTLYFSSMSSGKPVAALSSSTTAPSNWATAGGAHFFVNGYVQAQSLQTSADRSDVLFNAAGTWASGFKYVSNGPAYRLNSENGYFTIYNAPIGVAGNTITWNTWLLSLSSGGSYWNVPIIATTPQVSWTTLSTMGNYGTYDGTIGYMVTGFNEVRLRGQIKTTDCTASFQIFSTLIPTQYLPANYNPIWSIAACGGSFWQIQLFKSGHPTLQGQFRLIASCSCGNWADLSVISWVVGQ